MPSSSIFPSSASTGKRASFCPKEVRLCFSTAPIKRSVFIACNNALVSGISIKLNANILEIPNA